MVAENLIPCVDRMWGQGCYPIIHFWKVKICYFASTFFFFDMDIKFSHAFFCRTFCRSSSIIHIKPSSKPVQRCFCIYARSHAMSALAFFKHRKRLLLVMHTVNGSCDLQSSYVQSVVLIIKTLPRNNYRSLFKKRFCTW